MVFILLYDRTRQGECSNLLQFLNFKGYLRCKTITSQNVSFKARLRIFLFISFEPQLINPTNMVN